MLSNKERKALQRREYHSAFNPAKIKMNHGGLWIRKKEQAALGSSSSGKRA